VQHKDSDECESRHAFRVVRDKVRQQCLYIKVVENTAGIAARANESLHETIDQLHQELQACKESEAGAQARVEELEGENKELRIVRESLINKGIRGKYYVLSSGNEYEITKKALEER